jgi:carboxylesterase
MRPLGEALARRGFGIRGVRLAGHATEVADLAATRWMDWAASAADGLTQAIRDTPRVAVVGMSMGALLAIHLAATRPDDVAALVLCSTPLRLDDPRVRLLPWISRLPWFARRYATIPKDRGPDIADPVAREASRSYRAMPLTAILELLALQVTVRAELPRVTQPTLLLHGRHDHSVSLGNLDELQRGLGSRQIETHVLERSWHVITVDYDRDEVAERTATFLERVDAGAH